METFQESFPHPFEVNNYGVGNKAKTKDELDIIGLSAQIREKPDWHLKINDPQIVAKWKMELSSKEDTGEEKNRARIQLKLDYVLEELEYYLSLRMKDEDGGIEVGGIDGIWQSDKLIPSDLKERLIKGVKRLEDCPTKDWHPGSNEQVLDLVHPSLYSFVEGRTKVLKVPVEFKLGLDLKEFLLKFTTLSKDSFLSSEEVSALALKQTEGFPTYSKSIRYQWLPSQFQFDENNGSIKIASYINNLHPFEHSELYSCIEEIFQKFIPLFNNVLTELRHPRSNRIIPKTSSWYDGGYFEMSENQEIKPIEIPKFTRPLPPETKVELAGRNLQVIVKLANIHLTPEKPEYPGGVWHVEGMVNERIVSSGIYYFSSENVTESRLMFRQGIQEPDYEQYDRDGVKAIYGMEDKGQLNQHLGSIVTKEGRCISFPNNLQHCVAPFKLENPSLPGHRKILVFFLVDPNVSIVSTSTIPPQQKDWYAKELSKESLSSEAKEKLNQFLSNPVSCLMSLDEAKEHREELMKERKFFFKENNQEYFEREFSLCEH